MDEDRKTNNSTWVVDEFTEWIDNSVKNVEQLYNECNSSDKERLYTKLMTFKMVKEHFDELKYD